VLMVTCLRAILSLRFTSRMDATIFSSTAT
jgi:hypothetical protein